MSFEKTPRGTYGPKVPSFTVPVPVIRLTATAGAPANGG